MDLLNLYTNGNGIFSKNLQFNIIVICIILLFIINYYFKFQYILIFAFVLFLLNIYVKFKWTKLSDTNHLTMIKLQKIQDIINKYISSKINQVDSTTRINNNIKQKMFKQNILTHFYTDSNLIYFIYSIIDLSEYNPEEFYKFTKGINSILKIRNEIESNKYPNNINELLETTLLLKTNTINNLHNFIYTIPKEHQLYIYLSNIIERYTILITRNIDKIYHHYQQNIKINGVNNNTKFINYNTTKSFNQIDNHYILPNKNHTKLLSFYV